MIGIRDGPMAWLSLVACRLRRDGESGVYLGGRLPGGMWRLWQHAGGVPRGEQGWRGDERYSYGAAVAAVRWGPSCAG